MLDFDTGDKSRGEVLEYLEWCGDKLVLLCWRGGGEKGDERSGVGVLMVGPYRDWLRFLIILMRRMRRKKGI